MYRIDATNRCHLLTEIAAEVWSHIIHNHNAGQNVSEIGITNDIVSIIRNHSSRIPNFGVWANSGYKESIHGSDIDIFVESRVGAFIWYALQAKVLKKDGRYQDMDGVRGGEYQWEKLIKLSENTGCISRYLLYNGVSGFRFNGRDKCGRAFLSHQYGCSIVDANEVREISLNHIPNFTDFHPNHAQPWRVIVCCSQNLKDSTLFSSAQIKNSLNYYEKDNSGDFFMEDEETLSKNNDYGRNVINESSESIGREPMFRIVIRSTLGLSLAVTKKRDY